MSGPELFSSPASAPPFGERLPSVPVPPPGPASSALAARLADAESRNVTFLSPDWPVFWSEAAGANVRDADGNEYVDLTGAFGVALAGHAHPDIVRAVGRQAARLVHGMGDVHPPETKVELLERLAELAPWRDGRVVLASAGSEAVEIALKTALLATGRPGILAFEGGYHGLTLGALAATARDDFRTPFRPRLYDGVRFAPFPDLLENGQRAVEPALARVEQALAEAERGDAPVGAVVVEPVQGRGGVRVPPPGFLNGVADAARRAGALLVLDEIFTGLGRTGERFAFVHEGVAPDLLCLGKALGGGLPLSACLGSREVMDAWPPSRGEALHTSTFLGHPLACASALAFLDLLDREDLPARARDVGEALSALLRRSLEGGKGIRGVRGRGALIGIVLDARAADRGGAAAVAAAALRRGVLVLPAGDRGEVVELAPPVTLTPAQIEASSGLLAEAIHEVLG